MGTRTGWGAGVLCSFQAISRPKLRRDEIEISASKGVCKLIGRFKILIVNFDKNCNISERVSAIPLVAEIPDFLGDVSLGYPEVT